MDSTNDTVKAHRTDIIQCKKCQWQGLRSELVHSGSIGDGEECLCCPECYAEVVERNP